MFTMYKDFKQNILQPIVSHVKVSLCIIRKFWLPMIFPSIYNKYKQRFRIHFLVHKQNQTNWWSMTNHQNVAYLKQKH